jgi:hypothetical protein
MENSVTVHNGTTATLARPDAPSTDTTLDGITPAECRPPASADIFPGVGFRIKRDIVRPDYDVSEMFEEFDVADISDHLNRLYTIDPQIRCMAGESRRLVGPACTVKVYPGR